MHVHLQSCIIKFHMALHYPKFIRLWGCVRNFLAESFEMAHKLVKTSARRTNWQAIYAVVIVYIRL